HRGVAAFRIATDVLPNIEHGTTGRIDERTSLPIQLLQHRDGDTKRGQDDDVGWREVIDRRTAGRVAQELHTHGAEFLVHMRVVNDLASEEYLLVWKTAAGLIRVIHRAVDAITEAKLTCEMNRQPSCLVREIVVLDLGNDLTVIAL